MLQFKKFLALTIIFMVAVVMNQNGVEGSEKRVEVLKKFYSLKSHIEGRYFSEIYTSPFKQNDRATAGSIYFLLEGKVISHFHKIDCDEIWYYHEGCGMKIFMLCEGNLEEFLLGKNVERGERAMIIIPAGAIFAAENLDKNSYTFVSCMTTPKFNYAGFKLVTRSEIEKIYPYSNENILKLAYEKLPE